MISRKLLLGLKTELVPHHSFLEQARLLTTIADVWPHALSHLIMLR
jgi:hypothetical protein